MLGSHDVYSFLHSLFNPLPKFLELIPIACVASVSVVFSACSRHFSLFGGAKIGATPTLTFLSSPQVSRVQKAKLLRALLRPTESSVSSQMLALLHKGY